MGSNFYVNHLSTVPLLSDDWEIVQMEEDVQYDNDDDNELN